MQTFEVKWSHFTESKYFPVKFVLHHIIYSFSVNSNNNSTSLCMNKLRKTSVGSKDQYDSATCRSSFGRSSHVLTDFLSLFIYRTDLVY